MIPRAALLVPVLHVVLASHAQLPAARHSLHAPAATSEARVLEAGARAILDSDRMRVRLPLSAALDAATRVVVWLESPKDVRTSETVAALTADGRAVSAVLSWPADARARHEEDIGWFRIGYRVEQNGADRAHGMLSVGAIATNLMSLRVAYPRMVALGHAVSARVVALNPVTGKVLPGVSIKASLFDDDSIAGKKTVGATAITARNGEAILTLPALGRTGEGLELKVEGTMPGAGGALAHDSVSGTVAVMDLGSLHIETDKPLHKPGETVHLRALAMTGAGRAAAGEPVTVTVNDPDDKTLVKAAVKTNRFGIAAYDWKTSEQIETGDYEADFSLDNAKENTDEAAQVVRIQRYELPQFSVTATPDRAFYLAGQQAQVKIHAGYLFGKPVAGGTVRLVRADDAEWNPKTGRYDEPEEIEETAQLDVEGNAALKLKVDDEFGLLRDDQWERYRDVTYRALVTDASTGRTEPRNFAVRVSKEPVHIYLNPIGAGERDGDYMLSTVFADGTPAPCKVTLDWMDARSHAARAATVKTNRYGLARVSLHFPLNAAGQQESRPKIRITARDANGAASHFDDEIYIDNNEGFWISLEKTLLRPGEAIEGTVHTRGGTHVDMDILSAQGVVQHWQLRMNGREQQFSIPANPAFHGLIMLRAYSLRDQASKPRWYGDRDGATRSVLYPDGDHSLNGEVKGLQASYVPGAKVNAELSLRTQGKGAAGVFGVSVFDTAVEQRAETEAEANDRWFGHGRWWLEPASVGDVTRESLDQINTAQPIDADLDLAAEALLLNNSTEQLSVESNDDNEVRQEYQQHMEKLLEPLTHAILAALPPEFPATFDQVRQFATDAKLSPDLLLDPWKMPYKVETSEGWHTDIVTLHSAGPDKQFGTADDLGVTLVQRNVYAVPGAKLNALLEDTAQSGKPLPATLAALKALAKDAGLDLDSAAEHTLDRKGKPYTYVIDVFGRAYYVRVQGEDSGAVWQSLSVDYFGKTEAALRAALAQWANAGHPFPETEADARKAFAAAGIDFSILHDPLGKPFALDSKREFSYARIDKVKAGESIQGGTARVTLVAQVVRVLRADRDDEIARFAHAMSQQSGSDLRPVAVDSGLFQGDTGAIGGTVTDPTGAVIPGASVQVENLSTGVASRATTKDDGSFLIADLAPGFYKMRVDSKGFMSFSITDVHVSSSALTTVEVVLRLGAASETVSVAADAAPMTTDSAVLASVAKGGVRKVSGPNGGATITEQTMTPRLRHVFAETAYWAPSLETTSSGHAALSFALPDSLTTWKLHAVGSTVDGRFTQIDETFRTFQPFIVDLDSPQTLTVGDEITLPVNLRNYTARALTLPVSVKPEGWFTLSTPAITQTTIQANKSTPVPVGLRAASAVDVGPLRITAAGAHDGDAVEKTVRVHPDGEPRTINASTLLRGGGTNTVRFEVPSEAIAGSIHSTLLLYPNLGASVVHAMKAVLERPHGCAEQTISSAYPSLLYLELSKAAGVVSPERDKAQEFVQLGYDRLLGYFNAGGGLTYWGGNDTTGDPALTAYSIEFLTEAPPFVAVDRVRITAAIQWLLSQQNADGYWKARYGAASARDTLYIARVLETAALAKDPAVAVPADLQARMKQAAARATTYAATSVLALHDPWSNAMRLMLAVQTGDAAAQARAHAELIENVERNKDGVHWEFDGYSPFYGWGAAGRLETTALALAALEVNAATADDAFQRDALLYLLRSRDEYGIWMSGQATVRVLKAVLPVAIRQLQSKGDSSFTLTVNGASLTGESADTLKLDSQILDAPRTIDLSSMLLAGSNTLEFAGGSDSTFASAQITAWIYVPWTQSSSTTKTTVPGKNFGFDFGYRCEVAGARVGQPIDCTVSARRFGSESYGMMLAEVGLPPGADVDRASLGKLLDRWEISRYELQPDRIIFYLWSSQAEGSKFTFQFTPRYVIRAKAAPAKLVDYYSPDLSAVLAPQSFVVGPHPSGSELQAAH